MIGLALGTSEGKEILSRLNEFTEEIVVSTATEYGQQLYKDYKVKYINSKPLDENGFKEFIRKYNIKIFVDASHPYAQIVSKTLIKVCKDMHIDYIRYERLSYFLEEDTYENIITIEDYSELEETLKSIEGNVLNTTGSNNVEIIKKLNIKNRIIHRVLPSPSVIQKLIGFGVGIEDIIAIKGPFGSHINNGIIKEYTIKALITKDSGKEGGMEEKIIAARENNIKVIIIKKPNINYQCEVNSVEKLINLLVEKNNI